MFHASHRRLPSLAALVVAFALALAACGDDATPPPPVDAGAVDASTDAARLDLGRADLGGCEDADGDGSPALSCGGEDCDDADPSRYPGATEVCDAAGVDEDCDPTTLGPDGDGDGFPATGCCNGPTACGTDCDDARATVNITAVESCNRVDDDCDGMVDDGLGSTSELCNLVDDDCDGTVDEGVCVPCPTGFSGFDEACTDVDECAAPGACHPARRCVNAMGSYACEPCAAGYLDDGATGCADINECLDGTDRCVSLRACANTAGSYTCAACPSGYVDDGSYDCTDVDECGTGARVCDALATCVNAPGSSRCDCPPGYVLAADGLDCLDDDARLTGLTASGGTLSPSFAPEATRYVLLVTDGASTLTLTPTVAAPSRTTITVDGVSVSSGSPSPAVTVPVVGVRHVSVVTTAESGATQTVDVQLTRPDPTCPEAEPIPLDCTSGTVMGTTVGAPAGRDGYCPLNLGSLSQTNYTGGERFYTFRNLDAALVDVQVIAMASSDHDLFVFEAGSGCTSSAPRCAALGTQGNREEIMFTASPGSAWTFVYGPWSGSDPGRFELAVSCSPIVCGDGRRSASEECDDGNATGGDGCGADCRVEPGFGCACTTGVAGVACPDAPSRCVARSGPASCAAATPITGDTSLTLGTAGSMGGPAAGTGCTVLRDLGTRDTSFFAVTIPPASRVTVEVAAPSPTEIGMSTIDVQETCAAVSCLSAVNGTLAATLGPVVTTLENPSGTAISRIVSISNPSDASRGVTFTYASIGG